MRSRLLPLLLLLAVTRGSSALSALPPLERRRANLASISLEWLVQRPAGSEPPSSPPVLFVHGSFHGAWCWERWMGRFAASLGCECHAVSLRGTSGSPTGNCRQRSVKIEEHVSDLAAFVDGPLAASSAGPPVLVGHSFGGASVLKYLEAGHAASAAVLLCSVPPSGNSAMTLRFVRRSPAAAWLLVRGFAFKEAARSSSVARRLFFDDEMGEEEVEAHVARFAADSRCGINLSDFNKALPSRQADAVGRATWLATAPPALVIGAEADGVVDAEGVEETAAFLGTRARVLRGAPHDIMLAAGWEAAADEVVQWVDGQELARSSPHAARG